MTSDNVLKLAAELSNMLEDEKIWPYHEMIDHALKMSEGSAREFSERYISLSSNLSGFIDFEDYYCKHNRELLIRIRLLKETLLKECFRNTGCA